MEPADWTNYGPDHPCHGCEAVGNESHCAARRRTNGSDCYKLLSGGKVRMLPSSVNDGLSALERCRRNYGPGKY